MTTQRRQWNEDHAAFCHPHPIRDEFNIRVFTALLAIVAYAIVPAIHDVGPGARCDLRGADP